ncbi:MAG: DUF5930 domain-containing protein [Pseudomonadota bacterium]
MAFDVAKSVRSLVSRWFPERELYIRSEGAVRYVTVSTRLQIGVTLAALLTLAVLVALAARGVVSGGRIVTSDQAVLEARAAYDDRARELQDRYARLEAELEDSERRFDQVMRQLAGQHGQVGDPVQVDDALEERLDASRRRLRDVTQQRDDVLSKLEEMRFRALELERRLTEAQRLAGERKDNLDDFVGALEDASSEREDARRRVRALSREVSTLTESIEDIRRHQAQVMAQLEEAARASLVELEELVGATGVDVEALLRDIERTYSGEGGPFIPIAYRVPSAARGFPISEESVFEMLDRLQRVSLLRIALQKMPLRIPIKDPHRLTSGFGPRRHPVTGRWAIHNGMDFAAPRGTHVYAPVGGVVSFAGRNGGYGKVVKIRHSLGFETVYAHLNAIHVKKGQRVVVDAHIGDVGSTGRSTGNHLHYEIRSYGRPLNPRKFLKAGRDVF